MISQYTHIYNDIHICITGANFLVSPKFLSKSKNQSRFKINIPNFLQVIKRIL